MKSTIGYAVAAMAVSISIVAGASSPAYADASRPAARKLADDASSARTAVLNVEGISCAGCSMRIRRVLKKMNGVEDVRAGKSKKRLEVDYDADEIEPKQIAQAVKRAGFECSVVAVRKRK